MLISKLRFIRWVIMSKLLSSRTNFEDPRIITKHVIQKAPRVVHIYQPEKDFSPQVVANTAEVFLIEQDFTDGPVKGAVRQV